MPGQHFWPIARDGEGIATETIQRSSFLEWPSCQRPPAAIPDQHLIGISSEQPMQAVTSQRHDYVSKNVPTPDRYRASNPAIDLRDDVDGDVSCQMASNTTTTDTFGIPDTVCPRKSARPSTAGDWSATDFRMTGVTETSASYMPWDPLSLPRPSDYLPYCRPDVPIDNCTVYKRSYKPPGHLRDPLPSELPSTVQFGSRVDSEGNMFYPRAHDYNL